VSLQANIREIAIRCQACGTRCDLVDAVKCGWRSCTHCGTFLCHDCLTDLGDASPCMSAVCMAAHRRFSSAPIPVDRILVFARSQQVLEMENSFLDRMFFAHDATRVGQAYNLRPVAGDAAGATPGDDALAHVQTETWRGHHLVITRRRRGKFVTWERVY
jgi:hypothetical protein